MMKRAANLVTMFALVCLTASGAEPPNSESRTPATESDLRFWLENMAVYHRYTLEEMTAATGLESNAISGALKRYGFARGTTETRTNGVLRVLPYPGGRHPRIGFLDGAVRPQRETKFSVFCPWEAASYIVVDVPEAIWSDKELMYLAHTHVPTIWTRQGLELNPLEWRRFPDGRLEIERQLPNKVRFGAMVRPETNQVRMELWLENGSPSLLTGLRVQNCVMLKGAAGFTAQTNANKVLQKPYAACRSEDGQRWVITAWHPCDRVWANPPVPCLHSDPQFPDCEPGKTERLKGWLSFYEGTNLTAELNRITQTGWMR